MTEFLRYPHLERFGNLEVEGIELGTTYVFPKLDGTNASMWLDGRDVYCGSRNRQLSIDKDNADFYFTMTSQEYGEKYCDFLKKCPNVILYGEWLVPHTLKGYRDNAWKKFYVFDVYDRLTNRFIPYDDYIGLLDMCGLDVVPCYKVHTNGSLEKYHRDAKEIRFLLKDDQDFGEGVVIKNYDFQNRFGRTTWAKVVLAEFKEKHVSTMGPDKVGGQPPEEKLADTLVTKALVDKEYSKIASAYGDWTSKMIPRLLETVYHCIITEELYDYLKKNSGESLNFKAVKHFVNDKIKRVKPELF